MAGIIYIPAGLYSERVGVSRQGFDFRECEMCSTSEVYNLSELISFCIKKCLGSSQGHTAEEIASGKGEEKSQGEYRHI